MRESLQIVAVSGSRVCKLDGNIGRAELRTVDILRVIHVNLTYDFVATLQGDLLDHVSHLSVADQSYFHLYLNFICSYFLFYSAKKNANERNESLLSNCRVQLFLCKNTHFSSKNLEKSLLL